VDVLKVEHITVVGHYGCSGVAAALSGQRVGLADNWLRHIQDVRDRHRGLLETIAEPHRHDALVELNAIEQVVNVCQSTVMLDAWGRGQQVSVHGWVYGIHDGLLKNLCISVSGVDAMEAEYRAAIDAVFLAQRP
jgi:carbonic anhydrase